MPKVTVDGVKIEVPAAATVCGPIAKTPFDYASPRATASRPPQRERIRRIVTFPILALAGLAVMVPHFAGAAGRSEEIERRSSTPDALIAMRDFSRCVADRNPRAAEAALALDHRRDEQEAALRQLAEGNKRCVALASRLGFSSLLFAGGLAERLLARQRGKGRLAPLVAHDPARPAVQARDESEMMALCTVRTAPAAVETVLATKPASAAEGAAMAALAPTVAGCVAAGQTMRLNRPGLRALLALGAYRLAHRGPG
jgi:hypothetical protein